MISAPLFRQKTGLSENSAKVKPFFQAKLTVNQPGDSYEQEADTVADRVMRMPDATQPVASFSKVSVADLQRKCAACEEEQVQRKENGGGSLVAPTSVANVISGSGQPLDSPTRQFMESRMGQDFSDVQLHTDSQAAESAQSINALAYTSGKHIVFNSGQYQPNSESGKRLLAHELVHVGQQNAKKEVRRQLFPPIPIIVNPPPLSTQPIEISVVDNSVETSIPWYMPPRYTGPLASFFRGDVTMTNTQTMVENVIRALNGRRMHRLNIMDHGNSSGFEVGGDWYQSPEDVQRNLPLLSRLRGHFAPGGIVHLQNCRVGQNRQLICAFAAALGVRVYAGTGLQNPILGFNLGDYVSCDPTGHFNPDAGRPSTPQPPRRFEEIA